MKPGKEPYKQAALILAKRICRDAVWHENTCNWAGLATEDGRMERTIYTRALPPDFYDGVAGVAFFLLNVYRLFPHAVILKTLKGALQQLLTTAPDEKNHLNGFYKGKSGVIYVLKMAAQILDDHIMDKEAERRLADLIIASEEEGQADLFSGIAGIILFILCLYRRDKTREDLLNHAVRLGKRLSGIAEKNGIGYSWKTSDMAARNLTGYAHGASGIAMALIELYSAIKDGDFLFAAKEAFRYENSFFNDVKQNWPDFRFENISKMPEHEFCSVAWCHGAPGIGLARLRAYEINGDQSFRDDAKKAADVTKRFCTDSQVHDYSLCHGLFGNAVLLLKAASIFKDDRLEEEVVSLADTCLEQYIHRNLPVPNGYHSPKESPCLMQGNSGIGYFYLHLYDPLLFPSVLEIGPG